jgi:nucleoside-diphosphate-sugar epimerase
MSWQRARPISVLVTGANGFVGNNLCSLLENRELLVRRSVRQPLAGANGWIGTGDIGAKTDWTAALEGMDVVVHLAARVHVMHNTSSDPLGAFRQVNVMGTQRLTEQCVRAGVKRLVYLSSIKVNGEETSPRQPFTENTPTDAQSPYAISKREAEEYLRAQTKIETVIVRSPLVYGPGVGANFLRLINLVGRGLPLPLGWTQNKRSLVAVQNLGDFLIQCVMHPAAANETFLISDGHDLSTTALVSCIASHLGKTAILLPVPPEAVWFLARVLGQRDLVQRLWGNLQVDIRKAQERLDWKPPLTVDQAVQQTIEWYQGSHDR